MAKPIINNQANNNDWIGNGWIGRFAPTPSGSLHFGSLVAALGSYIIAKQKQGQWFLRIEDLDPPREIQGASTEIIKTLEAFGFEWDGKIVYQSQRSQYYQQALEKLKAKRLTYTCDCSRKQIQQRNSGIYDRMCRDRNDGLTKEHAIRIKFNDLFCCFDDTILGQCVFKEAQDTQDFIIKRRDGLFAYQLAVVADDIEQGVNHVVRGADILDSTPRQNFIYQSLGVKPPAYYHLPLAVDEKDEMLSKSKFSPAIKQDKASQWLVKALKHLDQPIEADLEKSKPKEILDWSIKNWQLEKVPLSPIKYSSVDAN